MTEEPKVETISFSKMGTFKSCPRKWKHTYIDKRILLTTSYDAVKGNFVHDVFERFYRLQPEDRTVENARMLASTHFATFSHSNPETGEPSDFQLLHLLEQDQINRFKQESWALIRRLWTLEDPETIDVHSTELPFRIEFDGITMNGFIDRIEKRGADWVISDYKTGKAPLRKYLVDKIPQLVLYAKALEQQEGIKSKKGAFLFLGGDRPKREQITITPTRIDLECSRIVTIQQEIKDATATNDFPVKTGPLCSWCPHVDICPEGQAHVESLVKIGKVRADAPALHMEWFVNRHQPEHP